MAYTDLTSLLKAIADAIRSKKGTTAQINAQNFPSEIESISTVSGELLINHYFNVKANAGVNTTAVTIQLDKGSYNLTAMAQCYSFSNNNNATLTALLDNVTLLQVNSNGTLGTGTKQFQVESTSTFTIKIVANGDNDKFFYFDSVLTKTV